jgi:hypothetical protein
MPTSIVRFIQFTNPKDPPPIAASAFAACTFSSSGFLNVVLYMYTRPSLLPRSPPPEDDKSMVKLSNEIHPENSSATLEMNRYPSSYIRRSQLHLDRIAEVNDNGYGMDSSCGEGGDLETMQSIDKLRRQLEEHERSLEQIKTELAHLSRRRGAAGSCYIGHFGSWEHYSTLVHDSDA